MTNALKVVVTVQSDDGGPLVFIAPAGVGVAAASDLGESVMAKLKEGGYQEEGANIDQVTDAFAEAGFEAPAYLTLEGRW